MKPEYKRVFIGLGSNLGDRLGYLERTCTKIAASSRIKLVHHSSVYETEPVGYKNQPIFLNMVVELESDLIPLRLLKRLNAIETEMGRERKEKWGPRTIDIDILSIEGIVCNKDDRLNLPHPQLAKRRFVLQPWYEITPDYWVIGIGLTVTQLMQRCKDDSKVRLFLTARAWQEQMQKDKM